jgi:hypothetical protein
LQACSGYQYDKINSTVPYDKSWDQLTPAQKLNVRHWYKDLPDNVEPPFPEHGLLEIVRAADDSGPARMKGDDPLLMIVSVDDKGNVTNVDWKGRQVFLAVTLKKTFRSVRFKPGKKDGVPVSSVFYYSIGFE